MKTDIKSNQPAGKKPILLCILDGWGIGPQSQDNAIFMAKTPNYDQILADFPHAKLGTSGLDVGLPEGQIGNSEVGHACIGSGRVIFQDLPRINQSIAKNELKNSQNLQNLIKKCQEQNNVCHLLGLLSDGGVHSHQDHIIALAKILAAKNITVWLHCFLDGRDVGQKSAAGYLQNLTAQLKDFSQVKLASLAGRYYAMDRDNNWGRILPAHQAILGAKGSVAQFDDGQKYIADSYQEGITDEFVSPAFAADYCGVQDGDGLLVANFRADRIRQICSALIGENSATEGCTEFAKSEGQSEVNHGKNNFCAKASMTSYSEKLAESFAVLFPSIKINNSLPEVLAQNNCTQLRIAETEKYAHVTFFFSGGKEVEFAGEERILVKSADVATYDLLPQMSAGKVGEDLLKAINSDQFDFIVVNYANPDMVGHSGVLPAAIKACEAIDDQLGLLQEAILRKGGTMLITADHGNIEQMTHENGGAHTAHTTNPVPLVLINDELRNADLKDGTLQDIAPTILHLLNIEKPAQMTGSNLINQKNDQ